MESFVHWRKFQIHHLATMPCPCILGQRTLFFLPPEDILTLTQAVTKTLTTCSFRSVPWSLRALSWLVSNALPLLLQLEPCNPPTERKVPTLNTKLSLWKLQMLSWTQLLLQRFNFILLKSNIATSLGIQFNFCISPRWIPGIKRII